ncbi:MAG: flagellar biosynthetic protein FliO [Lachnospiraceae bacterium]|nr:flagellar biosynthetic protein FliO [Lachnospiraceae bacterium]
MTGPGIGSFAQLITVIVIFLVVLFLAWLATRFVSRIGGAGVSAGGNLEIVEAIRISQTQVVEILRVGERYVAVAVSRDHVDALGEWSREELGLKEREDVQAAGGRPWKDGFQQILDKVTGKKNEEL